MQPGRHSRIFGATLVILLESTSALGFSLKLPEFLRGAGLPTANKLRTIISPVHSSVLKMAASDDFSWADGMARQSLSGITKEFPHKVRTAQKFAKYTPSLYVQLHVRVCAPFLTEQHRVLNSGRGCMHACKISSLH
jgi:hypothetical protein